MSAALAAALVLVGFVALVGLAASRRPSGPLPQRVYDPGRERRAERRARELMRSIVSEPEYAMYEDLGFISVEGRESGSGYAYLLYPHRPIVAYATGSGELLNEYCVAFRDDSEPAHGDRLPDADDVLAKWMSIRSSERNLIAQANMHVPGRQLDPRQVRRDLYGLRAWRAAHARAEAA